MRASRWMWGGGLAAVVCVALTAAACDEKLSDLTGPTPGLSPSFASIHANIITASDSSGRPACTNCHTNVGRTPAGRLNLAGDAQSAYNALVDRASSFKPGAILVVPGRPEESYLLHKLRGTPDIVGGRMPLSGPPFITEGQITVLDAWIRKGAPND